MYRQAVANISKNFLDSTINNLLFQQCRNYAVPKRKLIRKEYFVYKPKMKSRYKGNPNPRIKMILTEDVEKLGVKGSLVEAKRGVVHHDLIPHKRAVYATAENLEKHNISLAGTTTTTNVPVNVLNYLKKHKITLCTPYLNDIHAETRGQWVISRHDIAEYFHRHSGLQVPIHCMNFMDQNNNEIRKVGEYVVAITLNKLITVPVPLVVIQREEDEPME